MTIAFGISSLFFAILGVFIPLVGIFITGISGFLAWMSAGKGTPLGAVAVIINLINIFLLSPGYMLVVGLEAQHRTPDQSISFTVWMIVLFIQIAAIVVFIVNFAMDRIDFKAVLRALTSEKPRRKHSDRSGPERESDQMGPESNTADPASDNEPEEAVSPLTKTLIYKIHGGKKPDGKFWGSEFGNTPRNLEDIAFDGSRPHRAFLSEKKAQLKIFSIVISCIVLVFMLVSLRPDLFPFLKYSSVFSMFSKTFPDNYLDRFKTEQPRPTAPLEEKKQTPVHVPVKQYNTPQQVQAVNHDRRQFPSNYSYRDHSVQENSITQNSPVQNTTTNKEIWYIIELQSGENIITQNAIEKDGIITATGSDGRSRIFRRNDIKGVKKTML
jgi:hypothetical protein